MQSEEPGGVLRRFGGDLRGRAAERTRDGVENMRQEGGLVAPRLRLRPQAPRREIGRVGLEQQPVARNVLYQLEQVFAAPLVADPAGDADVQPEIEIGMQLRFLAGE